MGGKIKIMYDRHAGGERRVKLVDSVIGYYLDDEGLRIMRAGTLGDVMVYEAVTILPVFDDVPGGGDE